MSNKLKGVWVDGFLWENKDFLIPEKHLLQKLKDLDNGKEGCTAMNAWLADFLGLSKSRVSQMICSFRDKKLISVDLKYNGKQIVGRSINVLKGGMLLFKGGVKSANRPLSYINHPPLAGSEESNIILLSNIVGEYKESVKEKDTHIKKLKSENEKLKDQIRELKNEKKENQKSCAKKGKPFLDAEEIEGINNGEYYTLDEWNKMEALKKEKSSHVFPDNKAKNSYSVNPPLTDAKIKNYQIALANYSYPNTWTEKLKESFLLYCEHKDEKSKGMFGQTNVKAIIRKINNYLNDYDPIDIADSMELGIENPRWSDFSPQWVIDRRNKKLKDEQAKQPTNNGKFKGDAAQRFREALENGYYDTDDSEEDDSWARDMFTKNDSEPEQCFD